MSNNNYRIRTTIGGEPNVLNVKLDQTYDTLEILSLKLNQTDYYKLHQSNYGVVVGRVLANGGFGIPNAKVSIFMPLESGQSYDEQIRYPYSYVSDIDSERRRYNLLPSEVDERCHQDVGSFPTKRLLLDNEDIIEIFDKYYKYTTRTNGAGDYMIYGVPTGTQQVHVDIDLSDIGILSQRPRDMVYKGYNIELFESANKFNKSNDLDSLAQLYTQNSSIYVYPFWGDTTNNSNIAITRCDIQIQYKFEPTCVFIGSILTENGNVHIGKDCAPSNHSGKMDELIAKTGTIEMIRKTNDGLVEEFSIKGNRLIDENGVWCYQIPMNLDYITTDEYGNIVPTDNPDKGIPTRARVRFRISLDDNGQETALKVCRYLVPNNPRVDDEHPAFTENYEVDYEFGTKTAEENYRDLFWNCVYTVKSYIPRIQVEDHSLNDMDNSKMSFNGIKWVNHHGDSNPMPYNAVNIKLSFTYKFICILTKIVIRIISFINTTIISTLGQIIGVIADFVGIKILGVRPFGWLAKQIAKLIPKCISLSTEFCDTGDKIKYYPGCWGEGKYSSWSESVKDAKKQGYQASRRPGLFEGEENNPLINCVENQLAQENESTNYFFANDWINGTLYFPQWRRSIKPKTSFLFGLIKKRAKDEWCSADRNIGDFYVIQQCAVSKSPNNSECKNNCHKRIDGYKMNKGVIRQKETMLGQTVYYYKSVDYDSKLSEDIINNTQKKKGNVVLLFATDIVLLGSLFDCDRQGIPQFFKYLPITTFNIPNPLLDVTTTVKSSIDFTSDSEEAIFTFDRALNATGQDWGLVDKNVQCGKASDGDGGLFYGIGCSKIEMKPKSCINLKRICELGVNIDETQEINSSGVDGVISTANLYPDGFVSWDELYNGDVRSMFATLNYNKLRTKINEENGYKIYDFIYLHLDNFDGSLRKLMEERQKNCKANYNKNYTLEEKCLDYVKFRMGDVQYYYRPSNGNSIATSMPRYENSLYFYFGLKPGTTAIEKFNSLYFSECEDNNKIETPINIVAYGNSWCCDDEKNADGVIRFDLTGFAMPVDIEIDNFVLSNINDTKVYIGNSIAKITENENQCLTEEDITERESLIKDYKQLLDINNKPIILLNGDKYITIIDNDKQEHYIYLSYQGKTFSMNINAQDFTYTEDELKNLFDEDYDKISEDKEGLSYNTKLGYYTRKIGGIVTVNNIQMGGKPISLDEFKINVECDDLSYWELNDYNTLSKGYDAETKLPYIAFGVPKGNVTYKITITPTCTSEGSKKGTYTTTIVVSEETTYKLYINKADYDIIRNFKSGFNKGSQKPSGMVGWDQLSNYKGEKIKIIKPYDIEKENDKLKIKTFIDELNAYLKQSKEGNKYCPYYWTEEYRIVEDIKVFDNLKENVKNLYGDQIEEIIEYITEKYIEQCQPLYEENYDEEEWGKTFNEIIKEKINPENTTPSYNQLTIIICDENTTKEDNKYHKQNGNFIKEGEKYYQYIEDKIGEEIIIEYIEVSYSDVLSAQSDIYEKITQIGVSYILDYQTILQYLYQRQDAVNKVKESSYMDNSGIHSITLKSNSKYLPISYNIEYYPEAVDETTEQNYISSADTTMTTEYYIEDIEIPNITVGEDGKQLIYVGQNNKKEFVYSGATKIKGPYTVSISDALDRRKPIGSNFDFLIINKPFKIYGKCISQFKDTKINIDSCFYGGVYNGIPNSFAEGLEVIFETSKLGQNDCQIINTGANIEDTIPTKRYFKFNTDLVNRENFSYKGKNYPISGSITQDVVQVFSGDSFDISNDWCSLNTELYSEAEVFLSSVDYNGESNEMILTFQANNFNDDYKIMLLNEYNATYTEKGREPETRELTHPFLTEGNFTDNQLNKTLQDFIQKYKFFDVDFNDAEYYKNNKTDNGYFGTIVKGAFKNNKKQDVIQVRYDDTWVDGRISTNGQFNLNLFDIKLNYKDTLPSINYFAICYNDTNIAVSKLINLDPIPFISIEADDADIVYGYIFYKINSIDKYKEIRIYNFAPTHYMVENSIFGTYNIVRYNEEERPSPQTIVIDLQSNNDTIRYDELNLRLNWDSWKEENYDCLLSWEEYCKQIRDGHNMVLIDTEGYPHMCYSAGNKRT